MKNQEQKILNILNLIYNYTKEDFTHLSLSDLLERNEMPYRIFSQGLITSNFLEKKRDGMIWFYKWKSIKPNIKMAERLLKESREKQNSIVKEKKSKKIKSSLTQNQENILNLLNNLYYLTRKDYVKADRKSLAREYKIKNYGHFCEATKNLNIFDLYGNNIKWAIGKPNLDLVLKVEKECCNVAVNYIRSQRESKKQTSTPNTKSNTNTLSEDFTFKNPFNVEKCKSEPKKYEKEFKIFGITIYKTIITQL